MISRLAAAMIAVGIGLALPGSANAETVSLRADNWCPINCAPGDAKPGFMIEIARAVFAAKGIQVDYQVLPWARALKEARDGAIDGVVGANPEEAAGLIYETDLGESATVVVVRPETTLDFKGVDSLKGRKLGAVQDYSYDSGELDAYLGSGTKDVSLMTGDNAGTQLIRQLVGERIDVLVEVKPVFLFNASAVEGGAKLKIAGSFPSTGFGIAFANNDKGKRLSAILKDGVAALRESGELKSILDRYGLGELLPAIGPVKK